MCVRPSSQGLVFIKAEAEGINAVPCFSDNGNSEISKLFGSIAEKPGFAQLTLFIWKGSKRDQKYIGTIKNTNSFFDYSAKKIAFFGKKYPKIMVAQKLISNSVV